MDFNTYVEKILQATKAEKIEDVSFYPGAKPKLVYSEKSPIGDIDYYNINVPNLCNIDYITCADAVTAVIFKWHRISTIRIYELFSYFCTRQFSNFQLIIDDTPFTGTTDFKTVLDVCLTRGQTVTAKCSISFTDEIKLVASPMSLQLFCGKPGYYGIPAKALAAIQEEKMNKNNFHGVLKG